MNMTPDEIAELNKHLALAIDALENWKYKAVREQNYDLGCQCRDAESGMKKLRNRLPKLIAAAERVAELERERDQARKAINDFGNNPNGFDWAFLARFDELERENTELRERT